MTDTERLARVEILAVKTEEGIKRVLDVLEGREGMVVRIDRLEQTERRRTMHIASMWAVLVGLVGKLGLEWLLSLFHPGGPSKPPF